MNEGPQEPEREGTRQNDGEGESLLKTDIGRREKEYAGNGPPEGACRIVCQEGMVLPVFGIEPDENEETCQGHGGDEACQ